MIATFLGDILGLDGRFAMYKIPMFCLSDVLFNITLEVTTRQTRAVVARLTPLISTWETARVSFFSI